MEVIVKSSGKDRLLRFMNSWEAAPPHTEITTRVGASEDGRQPAVMVSIAGEDHIFGGREIDFVIDTIRKGVAFSKRTGIDHGVFQQMLDALVVARKEAKTRVRT